MSLLRSIFRFERADWRPAGALLRFLGVALSTVGGEAVGGHSAAVLAGVGALYAGIASFGGVHQARLRRMVFATVAAAGATLVGSFVQPSDFATLLAVLVGSLGLGVFAAAGSDAAQVALLATGTLIVFSGLHGAATNPWGNAFLVLGGGLGQAAVLMLVNPLSPVAEERRAVAQVLTGLARFARNRDTGHEERSLPSVAAHATARDLLREGFGYGHRPDRERLWSELELADALRGNLAGLERAAPECKSWPPLADWLEGAADAVARGRPLERRFPPMTCSPDAAPWLQRIRRTVEAEETGRLAAIVPIRTAWLASLRSVESVRAAALGPALRYSVALTVATAGYRFLHVDHGYWAPLSLAFCLRPDFASTITRGLGRMIGTVVGVALATTFVTQVHPGTDALIVAMLGATWLAFALQTASYMGYSTMLAFYVVVSVTLAGATTQKVGLERIEATAAGSLLALATALVWPRWEASKVRQALAMAFDAQAEYADAVIDFKGAEPTATARLRARAARLEAERLSQSAELEPRWSRRDHLEGITRALARLSENAARILAAHVVALDPHPEDSTDDLRQIAAEDREMADSMS